MSGDKPPQERGRLLAPKLRTGLNIAQDRPPNSWDKPPTSGDKLQQEPRKERDRRVKAFGFMFMYSTFVLFCEEEGRKIPPEGRGAWWGLGGIYRKMIAWRGANEGISFRWTVVFHERATYYWRKGTTEPADGG